jgi:hypothetical protein
MQRWMACLTLMAAACQVLCNSHSWDLASAPPGSMEGIAAVDAGMHKMKGIQNSVHLYSCTYKHSYAAGARGSRLRPPACACCIPCRPCCCSLQSTLCCGYHVPRRDLGSRGSPTRMGGMAGGVTNSCPNTAQATHTAAEGGGADPAARSGTACAGVASACNTDRRRTSQIVIGTGCERSRISTSVDLAPPPSPPDLALEFA